MKKVSLFILLASYFLTACNIGYLSSWEWRDMKFAPCIKESYPLYERIKKFHKKTGVEAIYHYKCKDNPNDYRGFTISNRGWHNSSAPHGECKFKYIQHDGKKIFAPDPTDPLCP